VAQLGVLMHEYFLGIRCTMPRRIREELWATTDAFQRRGGNPRVVKLELRRDTRW
jgi:hypothetical protein